MIVKEPKGNDIEPIPAGMHQGVCIGVWDIGSQYNQKWDSFSRKVVITWEIPGQRFKYERDGQNYDYPRTISNVYTASLSNKAYLRRDLESWRGKAFTRAELDGFDLNNILKVNCYLNIIHNEGYANIASISPLVNGIEPLKPESDVGYYSLDDEMPVPDNMPKWVNEKLMQCSELQDGDVENWSTGEPPPQGDEDDIPF